MPESPRRSTGEMLALMLGALGMLVFLLAAVVVAIAVLSDLGKPASVDIINRLAITLQAGLFVVLGTLAARSSYPNATH